MSRITELVELVKNKTEEYHRIHEELVQLQGELSETIEEATTALGLLKDTLDNTPVGGAREVSGTPVSSTKSPTENEEVVTAPVVEEVEKVSEKAESVDKESPEADTEPEVKRPTRNRRTRKKAEPEPVEDAPVIEDESADTVVDEESSVDENVPTEEYEEPDTSQEEVNTEHDVVVEDSTTSDASSSEGEKVGDTGLFGDDDFENLDTINFDDDDAGESEVTLDDLAF